MWPCRPMKSPRGGRPLTRLGPLSPSPCVVPVRNCRSPYCKRYFRGIPQVAPLFANYYRQPWVGSCQQQLSSGGRNISDFWTLNLQPFRTFLRPFQLVPHPRQQIRRRLYLPSPSDPFHRLLERVPPRVRQGHRCVVRTNQATVARVLPLCCRPRAAGGGRGLGSRGSGSGRGGWRGGSRGRRVQSCTKAAAYLNPHALGVDHAQNLLHRAGPSEVDAWTTPFLPRFAVQVANTPLEVLQKREIRSGSVRESGARVEVCSSVILVWFQSVGRAVRQWTVLARRQSTVVSC